MTCEMWAHQHWWRLSAVTVWAAGSQGVVDSAQAAQWPHRSGLSVMILPFARSSSSPQELLNGPAYTSAGDAPIRVAIREPEKVEATSGLGLKTHYVQVGWPALLSLCKTSSGSGGSRTPSPNLLPLISFNPFRCTLPYPCAPQAAATLRHHPSAPGRPTMPPTGPRLLLLQWGIIPWLTMTRCWWVKSQRLPW